MCHFVSNNPSWVFFVCVCDLLCAHSTFSFCCDQCYFLRTAHTVVVDTCPFFFLLSLLLQFQDDAVFMYHPYNLKYTNNDLCENMKAFAQCKLCCLKSGCSVRLVCFCLLCVFILYLRLWLLVWFGCVWTIA